MSDNESLQKPFEKLGKRLKQIRVKQKESLAEVSGAVEIDVDMLTKIEHGAIRPNEEILLLIMSHFGIKDDQADALWTMAGYDNDDTVDNTTSTQTVMVTPDDLRIVYTDMVHITANNYGVVMNFMQTSGSVNTQPLAVSRVGMSREHAQSVIEVLQKALALKPQQSLPKTQSNESKEAK